MNKMDLINAIMEETNSSKQETTQFLDAMISVCVENLKRGENIPFPNFGTLSVVERSARMGINPRTKEGMHIPASKSVKFKVGKALKDALNETFVEA